jgi:hypothetical protein
MSRRNRNAAKAACGRPWQWRGSNETQIMNTNLQLYIDEKGIGRAAITLGDSRVTVFGDATFLPLPLGQGLGRLGNFDHSDTEQSQTRRAEEILHAEEISDRFPKTKRC